MGIDIHQISLFDDYNRFAFLKLESRLPQIAFIRFIHSPSNAKFRFQQTCEQISTVVDYHRLWIFRVVRRILTKIIYPPMRIPVLNLLMSQVLPPTSEKEKTHQPHKISSISIGEFLTGRG